MQNHPSQDIQQEVPPTPPKIYFSQKVFGKPTKNRNDDPSMFDLLAWGHQTGIQASDFKKKERFNNPQVAYMSMISKQPWVSESQQNFINYNNNAINVNEEMFHEVQNYIHHHQSTVNKDAEKRAKKEDKLAKKGRNNIGYENQIHGKSKKTNQQQYGQQNKGSPQQINRKVSHQKQQQNGKQTQNQNNTLTRNRPSSATNLNRAKPQPKSPIVPLEDQSFNSSIIKRQEQLTEEQQDRLIQKFKQTTRWIPNSSFTTYFGKPPFENYGRANTKPIDGGLIYGTYLYSHNVFPHRGANSPSHVQSYPVALMKAKSMGKLIPTQPKTICKYLENKINNQKERQYDSAGAIEALKNNFQHLQIEVPDLKGVEKFGGTKLTASRTKFSTDQQQHDYFTFDGKKHPSNR